MFFSTTEDDLNFFIKWKTTSIIFLNGRQPHLQNGRLPQFFNKMEDDLIFISKMEDNLNFQQNGR